VPKGPQGQRRAADVMARAVMAMMIDAREAELLGCKAAEKAILSKLRHHRRYRWRFNGSPDNLYSFQTGTFLSN